MSTYEKITSVVSILSLLVLIFSLLGVAKSNNNLAKSMRLNNLQAMVTEMNAVRRLRASLPDVERSLFDSRKNWSDLEINQNLIAVQLANILEWAYIARRNGLIEKDVWESWVQTWRSVILSSDSLKKSFTPTVWTFGRSEELSRVLTELMQESGSISDPLE